MFRKAALFCVTTVAILTLAGPSANAEPAVLFGDTFDRPDSADLNESTDGKSGTLGALNWVQLGGGGGTEIFESKLKGGDNGAGAGWAVAYPDHNFVDAGIASGGGFSVSIDLVSYSSHGSGRWMTIAVGHSKAELDSWSTNNGASTVSDLFVGYRWTQKQLEVYDNGALVAEPSVSSYPVPQTMRVDYALSDFNAGSTVNYEAYLGVDLITSGAFTWTGTDENYIGIFTNLSYRQARMDNFQITADVGEPTLPGDADDSGFVDDDDLAILLSNWEQDPGTITTWALGDFTADTDVDDDDLAVLLGNWTGAPPAAGAAVPEPATLALLGLGGLTVLRRRRS